MDTRHLEQGAGLAVVLLKPTSETLVSIVISVLVKCVYDRTAEKSRTLLHPSDCSLSMVKSHHVSVNAFSRVKFTVINPCQSPQSRIH